MKTLIILYVSITWLSGVLSSEQLVQSGPVVINPGSSHTMTCQGSGGFSISDNYMSWIRQFPDGKLQWLCDISSNGGKIYYHDNVKGRLTVTTDKNKNLLNLKMDKMKTEDTAMYFCARYGYGFDVWGPGTFVTVSSATQSGPTVFPLVPCCDLSTSQVTIGCLSTDFLPAPVDVTWNSGSITSGIRNLPAVLNNKGSYMSSSYLTISSSDWKSNKYTCNVNHKPTSKVINKDIPECKDSTPIPPSLNLLQGSCGESGSVDLVCLIYGYLPDDLKIQWLLNGQPTSISPSNSTPYKNSEGQFESRSQISVPKDDWNSGDSYTCRVSHPPSSTTQQKVIKKCSDQSGSLPKVVLLPPSPKDLVITKEAKVTCKVERLSTTDSLEIRWKREDNKRIQSFTNDPVQAYDGTYTVTSSLRISVADWKSGKTFTAVVAHSDLPAPVEKFIKFRPDEEVIEPTITIYQPTSEEVALYDFLSLTCLVKGFSPKGVYIQWKKNGSVMDEDKYMNTEPILDEDEGTYWMFSKAIISKYEWNRGITYTCSAVLKDITSKEIKKHRGK